MRRNRKGFTLAELLVVVAIIAVLVAVAIPVFTASNKKAEEAVEVANARSIYADGMVKVEDGSYTGPITNTYGFKTYKFIYDKDNASWKVEVVGGGTIYHAEYTDFNIKVDGKADT